MSDNKFDLNPYLSSKEDIDKKMDLRPDLLDKAIKRICEINEKTAEQALIERQHRKIQTLEAKIKELESQLEALQSSKASVEILTRQQSETKAQAVEEALQKIRYYIKHNDFESREDDLAQGQLIACENISKILEQLRDSKQ